MKFYEPWSSLVYGLDHSRRPDDLFLLKHILKKELYQIWIGVQSITLIITPHFLERVIDITLCQYFSTILEWKWKKKPAGIYTLSKIANATLDVV